MLVSIDWLRTKVFGKHEALCCFQPRGFTSIGVKFTSCIRGVPPCVGAPHSHIEWLDCVLNRERHQPCVKPSTSRGPGRHSSDPAAWESMDVGQLGTVFRCL